MRARGRLVMTRRDLDQVIDDCRRRFPAEACGLLLGTGAVVTLVRPLINVARDRGRYEADPDDQVAAFLEMERRSLELLAIYHSHPHGPAYPSPEDLDRARYPGVLYLIVAGPPWPSPARPGNPALFYLQAPKVIPATLRVVPGDGADRRG